jgi:hypothetical protein
MKNLNLRYSVLDKLLIQGHYKRILKDFAKPKLMRLNTVIMLLNKQNKLGEMNNSKIN